MRIGTSSCLFSNSMVLALGLYFRERSSTLYIVITASEAVEVSNSTVGKAAIVELGLAVGRAARVNQLQQSSKVLVQLQAKQLRSSGSAVPASGRDSRYIGAIIRSGLHLNRVWVAFESHSDRRHNGAIIIRFI